MSVLRARIVCSPYLQVSLFSFLGEHSETEACCSSKEPYCVISMLLLRDGRAERPCQLFIVIFFLGAANLNLLRK